jgi:hypothetical protein
MLGSCSELFYVHVAASAAASSICSEQQRSLHATASPALVNNQQQQQQQSSSLRGISDVLETLVGDALAKQQTLERLQRSLDVAESRREVATCRLADVQAQNRCVYGWTWLLPCTCVCATSLYVTHAGWQMY